MNEATLLNALVFCLYGMGAVCFGFATLVLVWAIKEGVRK